MADMSGAGADTNCRGRTLCFRSGWQLRAQHSVYSVMQRTWISYCFSSWAVRSLFYREAAIFVLNSNRNIHM